MTQRLLKEMEDNYYLFAKSEVLGIPLPVHLPAFFTVKVSFTLDYTIQIRLEAEPS